MWLQAGSLLVAAIGIAVAAKTASLSKWWIASALVVVVVVILAVTLPPALETARRLDRSARRRREMNASWGRFQREVQERLWLFDARHSHSLYSLLKGFRYTPALEEQQHLAILQSHGSPIVVWAGFLTTVAALASTPRPGEGTARAVVAMFEGLLAAPLDSGLVRILEVIKMHDDDMKAIRAWLDRYRSSLETYARFARDQNSLIGEKLFREHFSV